MFFGRDVEFEIVVLGFSCCVGVYNDNLMVVEVYFEMGIIVLLYYYVYEQIIYVMFGKFEFIVGDQIYIVVVGDFFYK